MSMWLWILAGPEPGGMAWRRVRLIHLSATHMVEIYLCLGVCLYTDRVLRTTPGCVTLGWCLQLYNFFIVLFWHHSSGDIKEISVPCFNIVRQCDNVQSWHFVILKFLIEFSSEYSISLERSLSRSECSSLFLAFLLYHTLCWFSALIFWPFVISPSN